MICSTEKKPSKLALKIANEIADQFVIGFCDDRMVEHFAEAADKHLEETAQLELEPVAWRVTKVFSGRVEIVYYHFKPDEQAYKYYKVDELYLKRG